MASNKGSSSAKTSEHKRGEHIVNSGCRKFFRKVIDNCILSRKHYFKDSTTLEEILNNSTYSKSKFIPENSTIVYYYRLMDGPKPASCSDRDLNDAFDQLTVEAPPDYHNDNAKTYGELSADITKQIVLYFILESFWMAGLMRMMISERTLKMKLILLFEPC